MEPEQTNLAALFPAIAAQMRCALSNLHLAAAQLAPESAREQDPRLDARAAVLDQSYYQLLRLVNTLSAAARLSSDLPLSLEDRDIVELVSEICQRAGALAPLLDLEVRFSCPMEHHLCAFAPDALEQLLYHLLSNAFKFTPAGGAARDGFCCGSATPAAAFLKNVLPRSSHRLSSRTGPHRRPTAWGWD